MEFFKHLTAIVESNHVGDGTKIWHFTHVREGVKIGKTCVVGKSGYIDADVGTEDDVKIQNEADLVFDCFELKLERLA